MTTMVLIRRRSNEEEEDDDDDTDEDERKKMIPGACISLSIPNRLRYHFPSKFPELSTAPVRCLQNAPFRNYEYP